MKDFVNIIINVASPITGGLILLLNIPAVYLITKKRSSKKKSGFLDLLLNLAYSDLLVGTLISLYKVLAAIKGNGRSAIIEMINPILMSCMFWFSLFASIFNLMALTVVRWASIKYPHNYQIMLQKYTRKTCLLIWVMSSIASGGMYSLVRFKVLSDKFERLLLSIVTLIALIMVLVLYFIINQFANKRHAFDQKPPRENIVRQLKNGENTPRENIELHRNQSKDPANNTQRQRKNMIKKTSFEESLKWYAVWFTVGFFIFCMPITVDGFLHLFMSTSNHMVLHYMAYIMAFWNSLYNPVLYFATLRRRTKRKEREAKHIEIKIMSSDSNSS